MVHKAKDLRNHRFLSPQVSEQETALDLTTHHPTLSMPSTPCESQISNSRHKDKKVEFSNFNQYSSPPTITNDEIGQYSKIIIRPLLPSAERQPPKGILKVRNAQISPTKRQRESFLSMLQSSLKVLAGNDICFKRDTYINLSDTIRACENVPDVKLLRNNMVELCQYIERDITTGNDGNPNSSLVVHALILISSLQFNPQVATSFPIKFQAKIVEYSIKALEEPVTSKEVTKNILFVLAYQRFLSKILSLERVGKLINVLHTSNRQNGGKSITIGRIRVYRNLLQTSKPSMAIYTAWIKDLLFDMNSNLREIKNSAISFGFEAAIEVGAERNVSSTLFTLLKSEVNNEGLYGEIYSRILMEKVKTENLACVPQIWSVLILLLRNKPEAYFQSKFMHSFLGVLTLCFNVKNIQIQKEARYAWNRFIFAIQLSEQTPKTMRNMLIRPYLQTIQSQKVSHIFKSLHNLLYYAFRPGCSFLQLDLYWDDFVKVLTLDGLLLSELGSVTAKENAELSALLLLNLFQVDTPKKWDPKRAVERCGKNDISVDELPAIDSRWLRKSSTRVFPILRCLSEKLFWDLDEVTSSVVKVWKNYITSIASPALCEVKVSLEAMDCLANLLGLTNQFWSTGVIGLKAIPPKNGKCRSHQYLNCLFSIISTAITGLGTKVFTEKYLYISPENEFSPIATLSQQPEDIRLHCRTPLHHLILLFTKPCPGLECDTEFSKIICRVLTPFFEAQKSGAAKLAFITQINSIIPWEVLGREVAQMTWNSLAHFAVEVNNIISSEKDYKCHQSLSEGYTSIGNILDSGIKVSPDQPTREWNTLFDSLMNSTLTAAGKSGRAITIEILSKIMCQTPGGLNYFKILYSQAEYPEDLSALELARKKLSYVKTIESKSTSFDPFHHFYFYLREYIKSAYENISQHNFVALLTCSLLGRCPPQLLLSTLSEIQGAVSCWIFDAKLKFNGGVQVKIIASLWSAIDKALSQIVRIIDARIVLQNLETLVCSGIESSHKSIVNAAAQTWNHIFCPNIDKLEYSERVKNALLHLENSLESKLSPRLANMVIDCEARITKTFNDADIEANHKLQEKSKLELVSEIKSQSSRLEKQQSLTSISTFQSSESGKKRRKSKLLARQKKRKRDIMSGDNYDILKTQSAAVGTSKSFEHEIDLQLLSKNQRKSRLRQRERNRAHSMIRFKNKLESSISSSASRQEFTSSKNLRSSKIIESLNSHSVSSQALSLSEIAATDHNNSSSISPPINDIQTLSENIFPPQISKKSSGVCKVGNVSSQLLKAEEVGSIEPEDINQEPGLDFSESKVGQHHFQFSSSQEATNSQRTQLSDEEGKIIEDNMGTITVQETPNTSRFFKPENKHGFQFVMSDQSVQELSSPTEEDLSEFETDHYPQNSKFWPTIQPRIIQGARERLTHSSPLSMGTCNYTQLPEKLAKRFIVKLSEESDSTTTNQSLIHQPYKLNSSTNIQTEPPGKKRKNLHDAELSDTREGLLNQAMIGIIPSKRRKLCNSNREAIISISPSGHPSTIVDQKSRRRSSRNLKSTDSSHNQTENSDFTFRNKHQQGFEIFENFNKTSKDEIISCSVDFEVNKAVHDCRIRSALGGNSDEVQVQLSPEALHKNGQNESIQRSGMISRTTIKCTDGDDDDVVETEGTEASRSPNSRKSRRQGRERQKGGTNLPINKNSTRTPGILGRKTPETNFSTAKVRSLRSFSLKTNTAVNLKNSSSIISESILGSVNSLILDLKDAHLKKEDINKIEDKLMDMKRALYEAEKRGRRAHGE